MSVEVVIVTPLLVAFLLLVVAFGRYVAVRGEVEAASRDAVRAASLERDAAAAQGAATRTANASLGGRWTCSAVGLKGQFVAGGVIETELSCQVPVSDLGLLGLPGTVTVRASSSSPLDVYRRTGNGGAP
ncbi:TadE/TadG family type IV pilus assembly protein [Kineosporia succinea]|uniref:Flp pilus assembly protein TadG n=1 Tax=Kineosporia succinea TaxID=84632 RepID=A0ABT9P4S3_9ACTN|nr:TadE/TadG family type IV pilus assembly protein [Kineosporia succinea]MDP9827695.1 Flp pilus assembly protein TadG [Kineosporia succinea]